MKLLHTVLSAALLAAGSLSLAIPASAADLDIKLDRAQVFNIPVESKTLIIGNPAIADVSIVQPGLMVITGKAFGLTNLVSLDKDGRQIANSMLKVSAATEQMVTVMRGSSNETLHCPDGGICASTITLGDGTEAFSKVTGQAAARQSLVTQGTVAAAAAPK
jgi:Pilus formation protein N terminal region